MAKKRPVLDPVKNPNLLLTLAQAAEYLGIRTKYGRHQFARVTGLQPTETVLAGSRDRVHYRLGDVEAARVRMAEEAKAKEIATQRLTTEVAEKNQVRVSEQTLNTLVEANRQLHVELQKVQTTLTQLVDAVTRPAGNVLSVGQVSVPGNVQGGAAA